MSLSYRAHSASLPHPSTLIWDILDNLWSPQTNPSGYVSLGVAENSLMHSELAAYINNSIPPLVKSAFTYGDGPTGSKRCKAAISRFLNSGLYPITPIEPEHLVITSGVTAAIEHLSWSLCNPGEGILLGQPHYGAFVGDISTRPDVKVILVSFGSVDPTGPDCISSYENELLKSEQNGVKIKALMLCNPHNPLGRCYDRSTLLGLMEFCAKHSIHLISDEIYAFSTWSNTTLSSSAPKPPPFTSTLSLRLGNLPPSQLHIIWGMSKDFGANGLRLGCIISQGNPPLLSAIRTVGLHSAPSSLADHVAASILEDTAFTETYIGTNQARLSESYAFITTWAKRHGIPYTPGANATFFLWCDFGSVWKPAAQDRDESQTLTAQIMSVLLSHKVFLASGESFGSENEGYFRVVFSQPREYLEEGLQRIALALGFKKDMEK